jgi:hypothetical protein
MGSFVWQRDPDEAYHNPYEYDAQKQFLSEAKTILNGVRKMLNEYDMKFHKDDESLKKAIWLLQTDALCSLKDATDGLAERKHRPAVRLFRDVLETLDMAKYFHAQSGQSNRDLVKWYNNEVIPHSRYRKHVKNIRGVEVSEKMTLQYSRLSKFTHRTYHAITASCGLGQGDMLWHENHSSTELEMLPQPVAAYCAVLGSFILSFCSEVASRGLLDPFEIKKLLKHCLACRSEPRRFVINGPWRNETIE